MNNSTPPLRQLRLRRTRPLRRRTHLPILAPPLHLLSSRVHRRPDILPFKTPSDSAREEMRVTFRFDFLVLSIGVHGEWVE